METKEKKRGIRTGTTAALGAAGVTAAACAACCISLPLLGPVLAWLGIAGLGGLVTGWHVGMAAVFATGIAVIYGFRHWRRLERMNRDCGCKIRCST